MFKVGDTVIPIWADDSCVDHHAKVIEVEGNIRVEYDDGSIDWTTGVNYRLVAPEYIAKTEKEKFLEYLQESFNRCGIISVLEEEIAGRVFGVKIVVIVTVTFKDI